MTNVKAGTEGMSRQKRYRVIRYREGKCMNCGDPRGDSVFLRLCTPCGDLRKKRCRKEQGSKPWRAGFPGRPPLKIPQTANLH